MSTSRLPLSALGAGQRAALECLLDMDNILGRIDYPFFVNNVIGHDFPEIKDPTVVKRTERIGKILKDWRLTRGEQKKFRKVLLGNPRGSCKSSGLTVPLVPYVHLGDTEISAMTMSATFEQMGVKFTDTTRQLWTGESPKSRLVEMFGNFAPTSSRTRAWSKDRMVTERRQELGQADPTLAAYSVTKGPVSGHFDIGVLDDPVTDEMMERDMNWLDKVWRAYLSLKFVLNNDAILFVIMTRYDDNDLIGRIIQQEIEPACRAAHNGDLPDDWDYNTGWVKYAHLAEWEVFYDAVYENYDPVTKTGDIVYPVIWPQERIEDVRKTPRGESLFHKQLMNRPAAREDAPLSRGQIIELFEETISDVPEKAMKTIDLHCDFGFKDAEAYSKQRGDYGVIHVCAKDAGYVWRIGGYRGKDTQKQFGEKIAELMAWVYYDLKSKVRYITYEQTMGHGSGDESTRLWLHQVFMSQPDVPRATPFPIRRMKQGNKTKLQRIMDMNWAWQEGYVRLIREAPNNDPLIYQMLNQGYSQYDDDADAFADAFHEGVYKRTRKGELPDEIQKYMGGSGWTPLPLVHGSVDIHGKFTAERRTARSPGARRPNMFGQLLGRNR